MKQLIEKEEFTYASVFLIIYFILYKFIVAPFTIALDNLSITRSIESISNGTAVAIDLQLLYIHCLINHYLLICLAATASIILTVSIVNDIIFMHQNRDIENINSILGM